MKGNYEWNELLGSLNYNLAAKAVNDYEGGWLHSLRDIRNEVAKSNRLKQITNSLHS